MRFVLRPLSVFLSAILVAGVPVQAQDNSTPNVQSAEAQELHLKVLNTGEGSAMPGKTAGAPLIISVTDGNNAPVSSATVLVRLPIDGASGTFSDGSRVAVVYTDMKGQASVNGIRWSSTPGTASIRITASKGDAHAGILLDQPIGQQPMLAATAAVPAPSAPAAPGKVEVRQPVQTAATPPVSQPGQPKGTQLTASAAQTPITNIDSDGVVINNHPGHQSTGASANSGSSKKWIWMAIGAAAAAGATVALTAGKGGSTPSTPTTPTTTIGTPTVSIGH